MSHPRMKILSMVVIAYNLVSGIFGFIYILSPTSSLWNIFGGFLLLSLLGNFLFASMSAQSSLKSPLKGNRMKMWCIGYAIYTNIALFFIFLGNFIGFGDNFLNNFGLAILIYGNYFGMLTFGSWIAYRFLSPKKHDNPHAKKTNQSGILSTKSKKIKDFLRILLSLYCIVSLIFGCFVTIWGL